MHQPAVSAVDPLGRMRRSRHAGQWRLRGRLRVCLSFLLAVAIWFPAAAESRVALVIGNGTYANFGHLDNPTNDAGDVADALEGLGFQVIHGIDLDRAAMAGLVARFVQAARSADVSVFYYAGHGFQVDEKNYLVPTDAAIRSSADVAEATIRLDEITGGLAGSAGIHLFFLDACRNNPLPPDVAPDAVPLRNGLAQVGDAAGFLFAFATQPDNVAYDGIGRNSFFTQAFLGHLGSPGQDIATTMIEVRRDVIAATGGRQVPWENSSLTRQFAFAPGAAAATPDTVLWQVAATAADPRLLQVYLDRYPGGAHQADAERMLADLSSAAPAAAPATEVRELSPADAPLADALWDIARRTRVRPLVEAYLAHAPDGPHAAEAKALLASLPADDDPDADPGLRCDALATNPRDATAATAGVPLDRLAAQAPAAIAACTAAAAAHPDLPHYTALLGRATYAAGDFAGAAAIYRDAAGRGDVRAMASLALMLERGDEVPKDVPAALALYQAAAEGGSADGAVDLAVLLLDGDTVPRDPERALALLRQAASAGSGAATHNLGILADRAGNYAEALAFFRQAAALGETASYLSAAIILDEGRAGQSDPKGAADLLLSGVASDHGFAYRQLTEKARDWNRETIRSVQARLQSAGLYTGALDGLPGPRFTDALGAWRRGGYLVAGR